MNDTEIAQEIVSLAENATPLSPDDVVPTRHSPRSPKGGRNNELTSEAGRLRRQGLDADAIHERLRVLNVERFDEPLPDQELRTIARGVAKRYPPGPEASSLEFRPFPVDVLPAPLDAFTSEMSAAIGCDPSYIALGVSTVCAAAAGDVRRIRVKSTWEEPAIIWGMINGVSGSKKTPALRAVMEPARQIEIEIRREREKLLAKLKNEQKQTQAKTDQSKRKTLSADQPSRDQFVVGDTTMEAFTKAINDNPMGVLLQRDELAGTLGGLNQYKGGKGNDAAALLELFSTYGMSRNRVSDDEDSMFVARSFVCILGGIQPSTARRVLGSEHFDNGLASRFLIASPPTPRDRWSEATASPEVIQAYASLVRKLYVMRKFCPQSKYAQPKSIALSVSGKQRFVQAYNSFAEHGDSLSERKSAAHSKLKGYIARIALVFHLVKVAACDKTLEDSDLVDAASVDAAAQVVDWFWHETLRTYAMIDRDRGDDQGQRLLQVIRELGGAATPDEVRKRKRLFKTNAQAKAAMDALAASGRAEWRDRPKPGGPGRPARELCLVEARDSGISDYGDAQSKRDRAILEAFRAAQNKLRSVDGGRR